MWRLDNQQVESLNSSVRINLQGAPHIGLPLLSSRIVVRRHFADLRRAGQSPTEILEGLQQGHVDCMDFRRSGGEAGRFRGPSGLALQQAVGPPRRGRQASGISPAAAAQHVALTRLCPEVSAPTVVFALGFSCEERGGGEGCERIPPLLSMWLVCLRRYSHLWCVKASPEHGVVRPLQVEKLLAILEVETRRSQARVHSGSVGCSTVVAVVRQVASPCFSRGAMH